MNTDSSSAEGAEPPDSSGSSAPAWSQRDHAALPAPALGPKASLIQVRRRQGRLTRAGTCTATRSGIQLSTADGAVVFVLRGVGIALYLERTQRRPLGTHLIQSMLFASRCEFTRWCEAEPLRFDEPHLHQRLRRHGEEFFDGSR
ncbi:MAG: hypothetical protein K2Q07_05365 [Burkholderiaceae bacterium]|nr:hypothetical protein [Burkholderiaceae bacterium]